MTTPLEHDDFGAHVDRLIPRWIRQKSPSKLRRTFQKKYRRAIERRSSSSTRRTAPDLLWSPSNGIPFEMLTGVPIVAAVHDLVHLYDVPGLETDERAELCRRRPALLARAAVVTAVSEWTRSDLIDQYGIPAERIRVVPCAADEHFEPIADRDALDAARERFGLPKRFLLHVGTIQPRKGLVHLVRAHRRLLSEGHDVDLLLVGAESWLADDLMAEIERSETRARIHIRRNVPDAWLPAIYNLAEIFVMPSLLEGFGIPLLEAMACGVPVVATTAAALPEVAGGAAELVPPGDDEALTRALRELLEDPVRQRALRRAGLARAKVYSWERSARALLDAFAAAASA